MLHRRAWFFGIVVSLGGGLLGTALADTVYLRDGRIVKGQVIHREDGRIEIVTKHGGLIVDLADVARIEAEGGAKADPAKDKDEVRFLDGRIVTGKVTFSEDAKEIVITSEKYGETRISRTLVKSIRFRNGTEQNIAAKPVEGVAPITSSDEVDTKWIAKIDANIAKLTASTSDEKEKKEARTEILQLGVFALKHVRELISALPESDKEIRPVLQDVIRVAEIKAVINGRLEEAVPGVCARIIDPLERVREETVKQAVMVAPEDAPALLLHVIKTDTSARVKALCVGQLGFLRRYEDLAAILKMDNGQLRFVAALQLGEAGIYAGIPVIIEALKIEKGPGSREVRVAAIEALKRWTGQGSLGYLPDGDDKDTKEDRERAVGRWETWLRSPEGSKLIAQSLGVVSRSEISEEDRNKALDRWRDGNKTLENLAKREKAAQDDGKPLDAKDVSYGYETAAYLFKQALEIDPTLCSARISRAILLYEQLRRPREAETELRLVLTRYAPEDAKALKIIATYHMGRLAELESDWKRAESRYTDLQRLDPMSIDAPTGLGDVYFAKALVDTGAPITTTSTPFAGKPTNEPDAVKPAASDGAPAEGQGKPNPVTKDPAREAREELLSQAREQYKKALDTIDTRQRQLRESAQDLAGDGAEDFKMGRLLTSIREDRDSLVKRAAFLYFKLGRVEIARGEKKEALSAFKSARSLDPADPRYQKAVTIFEGEEK